MLDLCNIQGNILRGYASFPHARFLYLGIRSADDGRALVQRLLDTDSITPAVWDAKPDTTLNLALTFDGLRALKVPEESLATFPAEFQDGMKARAKVLGDVGDSSPGQWDQPWTTCRVHILVMIYGKTANVLDARCRDFRQQLPPGVEELGPDQPAGLLCIGGQTTRTEHFGFVDGLSNPSVEGVRGEEKSRVREDVGNPDGKGRFRKIPLGEFILGHPGEGGELAPMPQPSLLAQDATYLVFRKLEQNVLAYRRYLGEQAASFTRALSRDLPAGVTAQEFLAAKMMGRWAGWIIADQTSGQARQRYRQYIRIRQRSRRGTMSAGSARATRQSAGRARVRRPNDEPASVDSTRNHLRQISRARPAG